MDPVDADLGLHLDRGVALELDVRQLHGQRGVRPQQQLVFVARRDVDIDAVPGVAGGPRIHEQHASAPHDLDELGRLVRRGRERQASDPGLRIAGLVPSEKRDGRAQARADRGVVLLVPGPPPELWD